MRQQPLSASPPNRGGALSGNLAELPLPVLRFQWEQFSYALALAQEDCNEHAAAAARRLMNAVEAEATSRSDCE